MHTRTRLCTLVGELGWVQAALPSIQRGIYRGRSWESIDYLHTPAAGAGKMGYSWETDIPVCPHHGVVPGMQNPSAGHPHTYWMERSMHHQASLDQHWDAGTVFEQLYLLARWYQGCASITTGMKLLSSSCSFGVCCILGPSPPPMAVWGAGEGLKGVLEAKPWASRQIQSPGGSHQGLGKTSH